MIDTIKDKLKKEKATTLFLLEQNKKMLERLIVAKLTLEKDLRDKPSWYKLDEWCYYIKRYFIYLKILKKIDLSKTISEESFVVINKTQEAINRAEEK